jgi:hypothetical protein
MSKDIMRVPKKMTGGEASSNWSNRIARNPTKNVSKDASVNVIEKRMNSFFIKDVPPVLF